jgi:predicted Zn finger-like uncharacterized protein
MKITCQSCQSKYNVADEKVQGKTVKIRCRKCGATIVVKATGNVASAGGSAQTDAAPLSVAFDGTEGPPPWHVSISDSDQRQMTLAEIVSAYNTGLVGEDTLLWTDGMTDWQPLKEVEPVVRALHEASASQSRAAAASAPSATPAVAHESNRAQARQSFSPAPTAQARQSYSPAPTATRDSRPVQGSTAVGAAATSQAEPKRAALRRESRSREPSAGLDPLTGESKASSALQPSFLGGAGRVDDANKLTGERNENSVLFSLAMLTKTADQRAPAQNESNRESDDSGLIDLKALAAKAESMRPAAPMIAEGGVLAAPIGSIPSLGAPVAALSAPLGEPPKSKLPLLIGGAAAMAVLLVLGIAIGVQLAGAGSTSAVVPAPSAAVSAPSAVPDLSASASAAPPADSSAPAAASASVATAKPKPNPGGAAWHPNAQKAGGGGAAAGGAAAGAGGGAASPAPAPKKPGNDCGCNGDLMCLMKCSAAH